MLKRVCPKTLDKPILLAGLEVEDVALITVIVGLGSLFIGPLWPSIIGVTCWISFKEFKKDKPAGYLLHVLYSYGFALPGLIKPFKRVCIFSITS